MDNVDGSSEVRYPMFTELAETFGSPLYQLTPRMGLKCFGPDSSGMSREAAIEPRTNAVMLNYSLIGGDVNRPEILWRLVQTLDLDRRDDTKAFIQTLIARHLDAAAEENSTTDLGLGFRLSEGVTSNPYLVSIGVIGLPVQAVSITEHGYVAVGAVIGQRVLSMPYPEATAQFIELSFIAVGPGEDPTR